DEQPAVVGGIAVPAHVARLSVLLDSRAAERRRMALLELPGDLHVLRRARPIADRPPERRRIFGVDVLIHRDADLADALIEARCGTQRAPDLGFARAVRHLADEELPSIREWLVDDPTLHGRCVA